MNQHMLSLIQILKQALGQQWRVRWYRAQAPISLALGIAVWRRMECVGINQSKYLNLTMQKIFKYYLGIDCTVALRRLETCVLNILLAKRVFVLVALNYGQLMLLPFLIFLKMESISYNSEAVNA
jgi:hypothetical protein